MLFSSSCKFYPVLNVMNRSTISIIMKKLWQLFFRGIQQFCMLLQIIQYQMMQNISALTHQIIRSILRDASGLLPFYNCILLLTLDLKNGTLKYLHRDQKRKEQKCVNCFYYFLTQLTLEMESFSSCRISVFIYCCNTLVVSYNSPLNKLLQMLLSGHSYFLSMQQVLHTQNV